MPQAYAIHGGIPIERQLAGIGAGRLDRLETARSSKKRRAAHGRSRKPPPRSRSAISIARMRGDQQLRS